MLNQDEQLQGYLAHKKPPPPQTRMCSYAVHMQGVVHETQRASGARRPRAYAATACVAALFLSNVILLAAHAFVATLSLPNVSAACVWVHVQDVQLRGAHAGARSRGARRPAPGDHPNRTTLYLLYASLCTGKLDAIRKHECFLFRPFYERACRWALLEEIITEKT